MIEETFARTGILSVSEITNYIKQVIESDPSFYNVWVRGEVIDFKRAYSGHCYFKLKDTNSTLTCVMFKSKADLLKFKISDGMKILVHGNITLYEKGGNYQLLADQIKPEGIGELFLQFLQLKEKLHKKGYFDAERKKEIPFIPQGIGIATSLKGAGLADMIKTVKNRYPLVNIYISPTIVQGADAPASIVKSVEILNKVDSVDVIIVGRGGGSYEDLCCFNDECVAKAIYNSKKPVISGVGHETDITICDLVADTRAETPTAAAAIVVPRLDDLNVTLDHIGARLFKGLSSPLEKRKAKLESLGIERMKRLLENKLNNMKQQLDYAWERIEREVNNKYSNSSKKIDIAKEKLNALNPFRVLERGYAIVRKKDTGICISKVSDLKPAEIVELIFADGSINAVISEKYEQDS